MSIELKNVSFTYRSAAMEQFALNNITLKIQEGEFIGIAGSTGSGKSTLIQLMNGLLKPNVGAVLIDGVNLQDTDKRVTREAKNKVGLVFQYPEYQLFESTVEKDIAFGPLNFGLEATEVKRRVKQAMKDMQLDYKLYGKRSPGELSGGIKRRVAIAGVLALQPKYLILDEPTAGLDPQSRQSFLKLTKALQEKGTTIVMVTHDMDAILQYARRMLVMRNGTIVLDEAPAAVFRQVKLLESLGLETPVPFQLQYALSERGLQLPYPGATPKEVAESIATALRAQGGVVRGK